MGRTALLTIAIMLFGCTVQIGDGDGDGMPSLTDVGCGYSARVIAPAPKPGTCRVHHSEGDTVLGQDACGELAQCVVAFPGETVTVYTPYTAGSSDTLWESAPLTDDGECPLVCP